MPLLFRCRKPDLPPRLVHGDGDRIGKNSESAPPRSWEGAQPRRSALSATLREARASPFRKRGNRLRGNLRRCAFSLLSSRKTRSGRRGIDRTTLRCSRNRKYLRDASNPDPPSFKYLSDISKPNGRTRCSLQPVAAQVRTMLPVFCGISGSTKTT